MRGPIAFACVAVAIAGISGCGSPHPDPTPSSAEQPASTWSPPPVEDLSPAPVGVEDDTQPVVTITPLAVPTCDTTSRAAATARAAEIMTAFARPAVGDEDWWAALAPLLSHQAQQDYSFVDPANIPVRLRSSSYTPTSVGTWTWARKALDSSTSTGSPVTARAGMLAGSTKE